MTRRPSKILSLTIGAKSLMLAELAAKAGMRPAIAHLAEFVFPEGVSLAAPVELGQALAKFLHTPEGRKFSTREVVFGLPARRLVTRRKEVPPARPDLAAGTLRLQAETDFATGGGADADPFAFDFAGATSASETSSVLLIAAAQSCITQCEEVARAAGLKLRGITAVGLALGRVSSPQTGTHQLVVTLAAAGAELVVQHGSSPSQLRNLPTPAPGSPEAVTVLVGEIRRTVASISRNGSPLTVTLWDDATSAPGTRDMLQDRLGLPVTSPDLRTLATTTFHDVPANAYAPAVAVGLCALDPAGLPVDFLHSRLAPPRKTTSKRPIGAAIAAGILLTLAIIAGFLDINSKQRQLDDLNRQRSAQAPAVATATVGYNRLKEARTWTTRKPRYVACLRDLTDLFPDEGTIWATSLTLTSDNKGTLTGKAAGEPQVRALKDRMLASKQFLGPLVDIHEGARNASGAGEKSFTINFTYRASE